MVLCIRSAISRRQQDTASHSRGPTVAAGFVLQESKDSKESLSRSKRLSILQPPAAALGRVDRCTRIHYPIADCSASDLTKLRKKGKSPVIVRGEQIWAPAACRDRRVPCLPFTSTSYYYYYYHVLRMHERRIRNKLTRCASIQKQQVQGARGSGDNLLVHLPHTYEEWRS